ncbi:hypothetical protein [Microterricola pindariensis]|uniref:TPM domain-containing protein n=1 Tax=Microterricola pindariensis TaxID=478010 RepID=A0ABX5AZL9_9MICO|nr:hypothetical protein [Microterricola pindariensis]PPL20096.1 hypothetical protein GY24_03055 [Microterricola pindariensis]
MSDSLWWLPSLLVFAIAGAIAVFGIGALRRASLRRDAATDSSLLELQRRAGGLLVRTDNRVQESEDELGFAQAQFGDAAVIDYRNAIDTARRRLREAFLLQQRLDDAEPDTVDERRRWNTQIIELCTSADAALAGEDARFRERRSTERNAPQQLLAVQTQLAAAELRADEIRAVSQSLSARFAPSALDALERHIDDASELLVSASGLLEAASLRIQGGGVEPVADVLRSAHDDVTRSGGALAAAELAAARIAAAETASAGLAVQLQGAIAEAREVRDGHVDPAAAIALNLCVDQAGMALAEHARLARSGGVSADPVADLDALRAAIDRLDAATSAARGQQDRLEHARIALGGALVAARSHIAAARDCIGARRGVVGAPARTRLAEAERQLMLAEAESDPVSALDIARRAVRHADDAEALARYDGEIRGM